MRGIFKRKWKRYISTFILALVAVDIIPWNIGMAMEHKANVNLGDVQHYNGIIFGDHSNGLKDVSECTLGKFDSTHRHEATCLKGAEVEGASAIKGNFRVNRSMDLGFAEKPGGPVVGDYNPNTGNPLLLLGGNYMPNGSEKLKAYSNYIAYSNASSIESKNLLNDLKLADEVGEPNVEVKEANKENIDKKFDEFLSKANELTGMAKALNAGNKTDITQGGENRVYDVTINDVNSNNVIDQGRNGTDFSIKKSGLNNKVLVAEGLEKETLLFKDIYIPKEALEADLIVMYSEAKTVKFNSSGWLVDGKQIEISGATPNGDLVKKLAPKIVWVLPNAESVFVAGCGVVGSIIAPNAYIKGRGGSINGQTIGKELLQLNGFELHNFHFVWDKVINTLKGGVEFKKIDAKDSMPLEGVQFELRKENGELLGSYVTDKSGNIKVENLEPGKYYFEEIKGNEGYLLNGGKIHFEIKAGDTNTIKLSDVKNEKNKVEFKKVDLQDNNVTLKGAEFTLYKKTPAGNIGSQYGEVIKTDADGIVRLESIPEGSYILRETKAPEGYNILVRDINIDVDSKGQIYVNEKPLGEANLVIENVKRDNPKFDFNKISEDGKSLDGGLFGIFYEGNTGVKADEEVKSVAGKVEFKNLPVGTHIIRELAAPEGYEISNEIIKIKVTNKGIVEVLEGLDGNKNFKNIAIKKALGNIEFIKKDKKEATPLKGAEFSLYKEGEAKPIKVVTTGNDGIVSFVNLEEGNYEIKETRVPEGYVSLGKDFKITFTITKEGKCENVINLNGSEGNYTLDNEKIPVLSDAIKLKKVDSENDKVGLKGAEFQLSGNGIEIVKLISNELGEIEIPRLAPGKYTLKEIKAPNGYKGDKLITINFEVDKDGKILGLEDKNIKNEKNEFSFTKVSEEGNLLDGAIFTVERDGKYIQEIKSIGGKVQLKGLIDGKYLIKEKTPPVGYELSITEIKFSVENGMILEVTGLEGGKFKNKKIYGAIEFAKINTEGSILEGAEFTLRKISGEALENKVVKGSKIKFDKLTPGNYEIEETIVPEGYVKMNNITFTIDQDGKLTKVFGLINSNTGYLAKNKEKVYDVGINKTDEMNRGLPGAEFKVYEGNGPITEGSKALQTVISDTNGVVKFVGLKAGNYIIKETKAPEGYVLDKKEYKMVISLQGDITFEDKNTLTVVNKKVKGEFSFKKVEKGTNTAIEGAEFGIYKDDVLIGKTIKSDKDGIVKFINLEVGNYVIKEINPKPGYEKTAITINLTVDKEGKVTAKTSNGDIFNENDKFENKKIVRSIQFKKIDANDSNTLLDGAKFNIYKEGGTEAVGVAVSTLGIVKFENLEVGKYIIKEIVAPENYEISSQIIKVEITEQGEAKFTEGLVDGSFANRPIIPEEKVGRFEFNKVDEDGKPLVGAEFKLTKKGDATFERISDSSKSTIIFENLKAGEYEVTETIAPEDYKLNSTKITFTIDKEGKTIDIKGLDKGNFKNEKIMMSTVTFTKVGEDGKPLHIAKFRINKKINNNWEKVKEIETNNSGIVSIEGLTPGTYQVVEIEAPKGYEVNENDKREFTVKKDGTIDEKELEALKRNFVNIEIETPKPEVTVGEIKFTKVDGDSKEALSGAEFTVYRGEELVSKVVTGKDGLVHIGGLLPGNYRVKETKAPEGYNNLDKEITFTINEKGETVNVIGINNEKVENIKKVEPPVDPPVEPELPTPEVTVGEFKFTKVDSESKEPLSGAEFELYQGKDLIAKVVTGADGIVHIGGLLPNEYKIIETKAPEGYENPSKEITFTINDKGEVEKIQGLNSEKEFVNVKKEIKPEPPVEKFGGIEFKKVDSENLNLVLKGAEFELFKVDGSTTGKIASSDKDGKVIFENIPGGSYIIKEIKAPEGYEKSEKIIEFTVNGETGEVRNIKGLEEGKFKNIKEEKPVDPPVVDPVEKLGRLEFIKVDSKNASIRLQGAEFELIGENGEKIKAISGKDGKVVFENLKPGNYVVREIKAPNGYELSKVEIKFTVDKNGEIVNLVGLEKGVFRNEKTIIKPNPTPNPNPDKNETVDKNDNEVGKLPATGRVGFSIIIGLALVAAGSGIVLKNKK